MKILRGKTMLQEKNLVLHVQFNNSSKVYTRGKRKKSSKTNNSIISNNSESCSSGSEDEFNDEFNNCANKKNKDGGKGKLITPAEFAGMKVVICPSKKSNIFELPMGARVTIPEGIFKSKDRFTVVMVPPNKRADFCPKMGLHDKLASAMYVFSSAKPLKVPINIFLPSVLKDTSHTFPLFRGNEGWVTVEEHIKEEGGVSFQIEDNGTVVLMWTAQSEIFKIACYGGLEYSSLDSLIFVRFPRNAIHFSTTCKLQVIGVRHERIEIARRYRQRDMADVIQISEFFDFDLPDIEFERTVTVRLPLSKWATGSLIDSDSENPLMIAFKYNDQWDVITTPLKFTHDTVSFETRVLGKFCLVHPLEGRRQRVKVAMPFIEDANHSTRGDILVFAIFEDVSWYIWVECVRVENILSTIEDKINKGFMLIKRDTDELEQRQKSLTRSPSMTKNSKRDCDDIEFVNGYKYGIRVEGDAKIFDVDMAGNKRGSVRGSIASRRGSRLMNRLSVSNAKVSKKMSKLELIMQYHELLPDTYRVFEIVPNPEIGQTLRDEWLKRKNDPNGSDLPEATGDKDQTSKNEINADIQIKIEDENENENEDKNKKTKKKESKREFCATICVYLKTKPINLTKNPILTRADSNLLNLKDDVKKADHIYKVKIPESTMKTFFDIQPDEEMPSQASTIPNSNKKTKKKPAEKEKPPSEESEDSESEISAAERIPLLSNKSLKFLAKMIKNNLTFVAYLGLSENEITSIGFDCLAAKKDSTTMCYNILIFWKKMSTIKDGEKMVDVLISAMVRAEENKTAILLKNLFDAQLELNDETIQRSDIDPEQKVVEETSVTLLT